MTTPHPTDALPLPEVDIDGLTYNPNSRDILDIVHAHIRAAHREGYELAMRALATPIHDPAVTTPREVLVGESPVDRIAAPAQEQPKSDAQIILDIITLFERRPEFKAAFREEWLRYTGVEQQQAGAVVSDGQISDLWLMSVDCVGLSRDKAISFARAVLALSQSGGNDGIR